MQVREVFDRLDLSRSARPPRVADLQCAAAHDRGDGRAAPAARRASATTLHGLRRLRARVRRGSLAVCAKVDALLVRPEARSAATRGPSAPGAVAR
jgi:hypothetical protein